MLGISCKISNEMGKPNYVPETAKPNIVYKSKWVNFKYNTIK